MFRKCKLLYLSVKSKIRLYSDISEVVTNTTAVSPKISNFNGQFQEGIASPESKSLLEPSTEDISYVDTYLKPTFNFAAYINKSETLQEFVKLGVDLHKIDKIRDKNVVPFVLGLKFHDIKDHVIYLRELGLSTESIANIISRNPYVLQESLDDIDVRISYLKFKKFTDDMILQIIQRNAFWLSHNTQDIDNRLGFLQKNFELTGNEVRQVSVAYPRLVTQEMEQLKLVTFVVKEQMGFLPEEVKKILLKKPKIFCMGQTKLVKTFEYLHNTMKISLEQLAEVPEILTCRYTRLMHRHKFLKELGRDQFDPKKPNYVSYLTMVSGSDSQFAVDVAKSSVQAYNMFLKSL